MKSTVQFFCLLGMIAFIQITFNACKKDKNNLLPTVTIVSITDITANSAKITTLVLNEGSSIVTGTGVCWGKSSNPDLSDFVSNVGGGIGQFISIPTHLESNTTYFVRAFATNATGTAYSENRTFTTL